MSNHTRVGADNELGLAIRKKGIQTGKLAWSGLKILIIKLTRRQLDVIGSFSLMDITPTTLRGSWSMLKITKYMFYAILHMQPMCIRASTW